MLHIFSKNHLTDYYNIYIKTGKSENVSHRDKTNSPNEMLSDSTH